MHQFKKPIRPDSSPSAAVMWLTRLVDSGLAALIFVAPLFMGGRHPVGRFVFVLLAAFVGIAWSLRQCFMAHGRWRGSAAVWILLGGVALLIVQMIPLSPGVLATLSPDLGGILSLWNAPAEGAPQMGTWSRVSLTPAETRAGLAMFLAYGLMFIVMVQRIGQLHDVRRFLHWLAAGAVAMAVFGVLQYLTSNGKFVWLYEHPFRTVTGVQGSFINRNHFAHLLALGIGPLAFCLVTSLRAASARRPSAFAARRGAGDWKSMVPTAWMIGLGIVLFAGLMSLSRGGIIAIAIASVVVGTAYYLSSLVGKRALWGLAGLVLVVGVSLTIYGYDQVAGRLDDFTAMSIDELDRHSSRRSLWMANWTSFRASPWLGRGVGSHREFYKIFMPNRLDVEYTHAESGYAQVASEAGLAGVTLLLWGVGLAGFWCIRGFQQATDPHMLAALGAVTAGLATSVIHSVADFVWYIPATMSWTVLLAAIACRLCQMVCSEDGQADRDQDAFLPRGAWMAVTAATVLIACWMIHDLWSPARASAHWDDYLEKSQRLTMLDDDETDELARKSQPPDSHSRDVIVDQMAADLEAYLRRHTDYGRVHIRLAAAYLRKFQHAQRSSPNPMDLAQIRDAAIQSKFPSRAALDEWLDRAVGEHRLFLDRALWHARRGLQLCPVQGEGYVYLAELCFLEGAPATATGAYVQQALTVRPHDGHILFMAGKEAAVNGDMQKAIEYWQRSFHSGPRQQRQLASLLAGRLPVAFLLESFQPDLESWLPLLTQYQALNHPEELRQLCNYFVQLAEQQPDSLEGARAGRMWLAMHHTYRNLGDADAADACIRKAADVAPYDYPTRFAVGSWSMQLRDFREAEMHLRWCAQHRPSDAKVQKLLQTVVRQAIAESTYTTAAPERSRGTLQR